MPVARPAQHEETLSHDVYRLHFDSRQSVIVLTVTPVKPDEALEHVPPYSGVR